MSNSNPIKNEKQPVNYLGLLQEIVNEKRRLFLFGGISFALGILVVFTTAKEYEATSTVVIESEGMNSGGLGQFGALAGLAGINMNQMQANQLALSSEIYPDVIRSRDFLRQVAQNEFVFQTKNGQKLTLGQYYQEERPGNILKKTLTFVIELPGMIMGWFSSPDIRSEDLASLVSDSTFVALTSEELFGIAEIRKRIKLEENGKLLKLTVSMPEPEIAAQVNHLVLEELIRYVTEYKTEKQRKNLEFVGDRVRESERRFEEAQMKLASFRDSNQGIISQRLRTREEQYEFEFNIAFNVYNTLKQEYEQTAIQLKKETPVFTILEKAAIPLSAATPNKPLIIIFSSIIGLLVGFLVNFYRVLVSKI